MKCGRRPKTPIPEKLNGGRALYTVGPMETAEQNNGETPVIGIPHIAFDATNFGAQLALAFIKSGVVVVEGVFAAEECDQAMDEIVTAFEQLSPNLRRDEPKTWIRANLPPQTRAGLYQAVVGNLAPMWRLRTDPRVARIFSALYSALRGEPVTDFIVSGDGLNLKPNRVGPYEPTKDWPHLDQTDGSPFLCIQGQAVLTNTSASLRASPGSHLAFGKVLAATGGQSRAGWRKFDPTAAISAEAVVLEAGGQWQVPVLSPRGSFIVWASSLIHSARVQLGPEPDDAADPWKGWRGVVYICYRPRVEFSATQLKKRREALEQNRVTNHRGTKIFPVNPMARYGPPPPGLCHAGGPNFVTRPTAVYELLGRPAIAPGRERRLAGYDDVPTIDTAPEPASPPPEPMPTPPEFTDAELDELLGL